MARDESRPLRADAQRNRDKILTTAVRVFAEEGLDAHFERIAKEAGVGSGTLYRNFPTREALIEAAYRNEVAKLCDAVPELLGALPPRQALRAWMERFLDYATAKSGMADALRAMIAAGGDPYGNSQEQMVEAIWVLLRAGSGAGVIRPDVVAPDVLVMLTGIALAAGRGEQREQAGRLLELALEGMSAGLGHDVA
jgi:AcrR family transcriptional regulator